MTTVAEPQVFNMTDNDVADEKVEEKFPKENFRANREMRNEIWVYESILLIFWTKIASKCRENCVKI